MEAEYSIPNGYPHNAEIIYGDTDSVMVRFGPTDLEKVMAMGTSSIQLQPPHHTYHHTLDILTPHMLTTTLIVLHFFFVRVGSEAADFVSAKFVKPIKLEFEKVYYPYLLISKKRYAGLYWTKPEKYDKMDSKGIEVRHSIQS